MEIQWNNVETIPREQREGIEERLRKLAEGHSDLIDIRITMRPTQHHRSGGQEIRITCEARGEEIVASRTRAEIGLALDESLDAFEREVRRMRHRRQDRLKVRAAGPPDLGVVDRLFPERDHGFILTDGGERIYFHRNAVKHGMEFDRLEEGTRVALNVEAGDKGPQASVVCPPPPDAPSP